MEVVIINLKNCNLFEDYGLGSPLIKVLISELFYFMISS